MFSHFKGSTFESSFRLVLNSKIQDNSADLALECRVAGAWLLNFESWLVQMKDARELNREMYFSRFPPSIESLTRYLERGPIESPNQILFLIADGKKTLYGHVGLKLNNPGEIHVDNVLRVAGGSPGIIGKALQEILTWGNKNLGISEYGLQVISTNQKAIQLYQGLGFLFEESKNLRIENLPNNCTSLVPSTKENSNTTEEMLIMKVKL
jgi:RimJ/RimL family protein N-acetyltransferase